MGCVVNVGAISYTEFVPLNTTDGGNFKIAC